jgi:peroxiredoxin
VHWVGWPQVLVEVMPVVLLIIRVVLCGVFAAAGLAKLADRAQCRQMLVAFGVPNVLADSFAVVLPVVELIVAALLLPIASAWFAAVSALLLLVLFTGGIAFNISQGHRPECNCFGQIHSAPIGWPTLVRNIVLAALASFMIWRGKESIGPSVVSWVGDLTVAQRVTALFELAAITLLATGIALLGQMLRQQGRLLLRLDGLETRLSNGVTGAVATTSSRTGTGLQIGSRAPSFQLDSLDGRSVTLEGLLAPGKGTVLLFTNPNCGPCGALMPEVGAWQREHAWFLTIVLVSEGTADENRSKSAIDEPSLVLLQQKREVAENYHAWGTPAAVLVRSDGKIGSFVAQGADAIRTLVVQAALGAHRTPAKADGAHHQNGLGANGGHAAAHGPAAKVGDPAPTLDLLDLSGKRVSSKDLRIGKLLLLFWNPACGFCQQMLKDLRDWEKDPPPGSPTLVLVSTGTVEENLAMQLQSRVMIDDAQRAASAFGAHGTPMGVLIDEKGRIASEIVAGARAVLELANTGSENRVPEALS